LQALREGRADAGALAESTWDRQLAAAKVDSAQIRPIWTSPGYCHCNFTALADFPEERGRQWTNSLLAMRYDQPRWRQLMDLEGLKRWIRPDAEIMEGYRVLFDAVEKQNLARTWEG
jgi:ABC-type phosphate/phosphonate transport system substrate-binding protein